MGGTVSEKREGTVDLVSHLELHHEPRIRSTCRRGSGTGHQPARTCRGRADASGKPGERAGLVGNGPTYVSWGQVGHPSRHVMPEADFQHSVGGLHAEQRDNPAVVLAVGGAMSHHPVGQVPAHAVRPVELADHPPEDLVLHVHGGLNRSRQAVTSHPSTAS
jgi:hypothetical protein